MSLFFTLAGVAAVLFSIIALVLFFGDPKSNTPLGALARLFAITIPNAVWAIAKAVGIAWIISMLKGVVNWFLFKRHPIVLIAYICLVVGTYGVFVIHGYPLIPNLYMAAYHKYLGAMVFAGCIITFCLAAFTDPGTITKENIAAYQRLYPYDNVLFVAPSDDEKRECKSCAMPKVARSKHSRVTDRCVARFDHYCIWLANDVGARNYRWFMAFLVFNTTLMAYGTVACITIFADIIKKNRLLEATFVNQATGERMGASYYIVFSYLMSLKSELIMVLILASVMGAVLMGFTSYHTWLLVNNTTTNESYKWSDVRWHRDQAVKRAKDHYKNTGEKMTVSPMPDNVYDRGTLTNILEVMFPPTPGSDASASASGSNAKVVAAADTRPREGDKAGSASGTSGSGSTGSGGAKKRKGGNR